MRGNVVVWCDKLASTPTVGFALDWHFAPADSLLESMSPFLDKLGQGLRPRFNVERHASFEVNFTTDDGFQYAVGPRQISVAFHHKMKVKATSGAPPTMEMLSQPLPYTKLLNNVIDKLVDATLLIAGPKARQVNRVGIVSTTRVAIEDAPPGIARFVQYIGRPWKGFADFYNINITSDLAKTKDWSDRCIHILTKAEEDEDKLLRIQLDWQRTLAIGRAITKDTLRELLAGAEKEANAYFEDIAEGSRFDEDVIRETTRI